MTDSTFPGATPRPLYFSFDRTGNGFDTHETLEKAANRAHAALNEYRMEASNGWDSEAEDICYGVVIGRVVETENREATAEEKESFGESLDRILDYGITEDAPDYDALRTERDHWKKCYYDVADAVARESTRCEDLCRQAKETRTERDALKTEIQQWAEAALVGLAGIVCTPEAGYLKDGRVGQFRTDMESMRKHVGAVERDVMRLEALVAVLKTGLDEHWASHPQNVASIARLESKSPASALK